MPDDYAELNRSWNESVRKKRQDATHAAMDMKLPMNATVKGAPVAPGTILGDILDMDTIREIVKLVTPMVGGPKEQE